MENCGNISIHCSTDLNTSLYSFGISQPNKNVPYFWGGETITLPTGEKFQKFSLLCTGIYRWFVKRLSDGLIVKSDYSQVVCNMVSGGNIEDIEDLQANKMSTAKGVELAGIIQNEVYQTILNFAKKQSEYIFYETGEISVNLNTSLEATTDKNIVKIFSNYGILLSGATTENAQTFSSAVLSGKDELDYIISKNESNYKVLFNPLSFDSLVGFQFFCKVNKYKNYLIEDFLKSGDNGGFGNDNDTTLDILPDFILTLEQ